MKVVFIHGKDRTPNNIWYPWLKKEVEKKGIKFIAPELPNTNDPILSEWLNEIDKTTPNENTILIGHSRGGLAILRWLEQLSESKRVKKVILVAASNSCIKEKNQKKDTHGFYEKGPLNFEKIKSHCNDFVVIHSKDDHWVPFKSGEENAKRLNAKFKVYENKRHFGYGIDKVPEVLEEIK